MLSVVLPFLHFEASLFEKRCLELAGQNIEVLGVLPEEELGRFDQDKLARLSTFRNVKLLTSKQKSRSAQINSGAKQASAKYLAILHVDTIVRREALLDVCKKLDEVGREALAYFKLRFDEQAPPMCHLNAFFANQRSKIFSMPFGDQVFVMSRSNFIKWGQMPDSFSSGEDHAFVQRLRRRGVTFLAMPQAVVSSARKYRQHGWARTTFKHVYLTFLQEWTSKGSAS